ncbi:MAG: hypothetical protein IH941_05400 [Acidobacteria bacterium]|nr:hypothetical protein [Acidobacteriota bacterium]
MCGDGPGDFIGALGGHIDVEVEEFVDPALIFGRGVGEILGRLVCQVVELRDPFHRCLHASGFFVGKVDASYVVLVLVKKAVDHLPLADDEF